MKKGAEKRKNNDRRLGYSTQHGHGGTEGTSHTNGTGTASNGTATTSVTIAAGFRCNFELDHSRYYQSINKWRR